MSIFPPIFPSEKTFLPTATTMELPAILAAWKLVNWSPPSSGGPILQLLSASTLMVVPFSNKTNPIHIPLFPVATCPFQQISCDFITDLPHFDSFDSLLVMINHGLIKGVILCPMKKTITAEGVATLFFHKVFLYFGLYNKVISDWGPQFASAFIKELGKLLNYNLFLFTAYHPQSDGKTKQVNQEIETYLQVFCENNPTSWTESIFHAEFAHNHHPHSVTSQSLFFLMMSYKLHALPSSVLHNSAIPAVKTRLKI